MKILAAIAFSLVAASSANAAVTTYSSSASFNAAVSGATTSTFGSSAGSTYVGGTGVAGPGYTISSFYLFNNAPSYTTYYYDWGTGNVLTSGAGYTVTFNFTAPVTAFGLNLSTFIPALAATTTYGYDVALSTSQGNFVVNTFDRPTMAFFGATSDTAFTGFTLSVANSSIFFNMDNLTLATANVAAAVPEPASWAMMLMGFGLIGGAARYRRQSTKLAYATA